MTLSTAKGLAADILDAGAGVSVFPNQNIANDWLVQVIIPTGITVDAKQVASLETKYGITAPVTTIQFR
jgi:hypothetical protein